MSGSHHTEAPRRSIGYYLDEYLGLIVRIVVVFIVGSIAFHEFTKTEEERATETAVRVEREANYEKRTMEKLTYWRDTTAGKCFARLPQDGDDILFEISCDGLEHYYEFSTVVPQKSAE